MRLRRSRCARLLAPRGCRPRAAALPRRAAPASSSREIAVRIPALAAADWHEPRGRRRPGRGSRRARATRRLQARSRPATPARARSQRSRQRTSRSSRCLGRPRSRVRADWAVEVMAGRRLGRRVARPLARPQRRGAPPRTPVCVASPGSTWWMDGSRARLSSRPRARQRPNDHPTDEVKSTL